MKAGEWFDYTKMEEGSKIAHIFAVDCDTKFLSIKYPIYHKYSTTVQYRIDPTLNLMNKVLPHSNEISKGKKKNML